jgi:hypothetical protein
MNYDTGFDGTSMNGVKWKGSNIVQFAKLLIDLAPKYYILQGSGCIGGMDGKDMYAQYIRRRI